MEVTRQFTDHKEKLAWCEETYGKLIKLLNWMGKWKDEGISRTVYDKFPLRVRNVYPYSSGKLSEADWSDFKDNMFYPFRIAIWNLQSNARTEAHNGNLLNSDLDGDVS